MEEKQKILRKRAKALARLSMEDALEEHLLEVVQFRLARENYALESAYIREVVNFSGLTPVPCTPSFIAGIINLRGQIVSVVDLKVLFDLPLSAPPDSAKVIILNHNEMEMGLLVDKLKGATAFAIDLIQPSPSSLTDKTQAYLKGVFGRDVAVLDAKAVLSDESLIVDEDVGA
ncbi:chemotaxis protein CheW [Desulfonatronovibrio magnus]|uniref:chemotaxis protein CheW n=1 Tax=Desulfonatronovibrio magnus TaxID=698827 RepID=UPI0018DCF18F|nr:chemotaxis protein CheW [Desulfonatronovibrio magnus]